MLERVREYAEEQLALSGELERIRMTHAACCSRQTDPVAAARKRAQWMSAASPPLTKVVIERLEAAFDNLQSALHWWVTDCRPAEGMRLPLALYALWSRFGNMCSAGAGWKRC